jgi:hypothetical protein
MRAESTTTLFSVKKKIQFVFFMQTKRQHHCLLKKKVGEFLGNAVVVALLGPAACKTMYS